MDKNTQDPTEYQLKHEKAIRTAPTPKLKHSKGRLYLSSHSGNAVEVKEKTCVVCCNNFYVAKNYRRGRAAHGLRPSKCITCSKECSRINARNKNNQNDYNQ